MFYIITIVVCMALITGVNFALNGLLYNLEIWFIPVAVAVSTVAVIVVDGIFATAIRRLLPTKWFSHEKKIFSVGKRECRFYEKIGIKKWKDKVIELGMFTNFRKNKISDPESVEYVERFLLESNYGVVIHIVCVLVGFLIVFLFDLKYALMFGIPVAFVNAVLNALPIFILRYNTPKLQTLRKLNLRRAARKTQTQADSTATEERTA